MILITVAFHLRFISVSVEKMYDRKWTILETVIYSLFASYHGIFMLFKHESFFSFPKHTEIFYYFQIK